MLPVEPVIFRSLIADSRKRDLLLRLGLTVLLLFIALVVAR